MYVEGGEVLGGVGVGHSGAATYDYVTSHSVVHPTTCQQHLLLPSSLLAASVVVDISEEQQQRAVVSHHLFGNRMRGSKRSQSTIGHGG